jgi:hypothetical protein
MSDPTTAYSAVYHFRDEHLLEMFVSKIPHSQLLEQLRNDEALRNLYFRGFRISNTVPTRQQVLKAYKREIVDRNNGDLASTLCAHWIRQQPALASMALKSLGIDVVDPADAYSWISDVQRRIELDQSKGGIRALVRSLAMKRRSEELFFSEKNYSAVRPDSNRQRSRSSRPTIQIPCRLSNSYARVGGQQHAIDR